MEWDEIWKCEHEWGNYFDMGRCGTPYCSWDEKRCIKCRVYETECGCGFENGLSREPRKKTINRYLKKCRRKNNA